MHVRGCCETQGPVRFTPSRFQKSLLDRCGDRPCDLGRRTLAGDTKPTGLLDLTKIAVPNARLQSEVLLVAIPPGRLSRNRGFRSDIQQDRHVRLR